MSQNHSEKLMKAQIIEDYCEVPSFIYREDLPRPVITDDHQVLVRMKASSVNPADNHLRSGHVKMVFKLKFPCILGLDGSGVVSQVGSKVTNFKVGDEVCGCLPDSKTGTNAEYCMFEEDDLVKKPQAMSFEQAAAFGIVGGTVLEAFKKHPLIAQVFEKEVERAAGSEDGLSAPSSEKPDLKILVIGASGGTGSTSILFAKHFLSRHFKVKIYGVCSEKNVEMVKSLGADVVIDYTKTSAKFGADLYHNRSSNLPSICETIHKVYGDDHVDLVIDCVGGYYYYDDISRHFDCSKARPYLVYASLIPPGPSVISFSFAMSTLSYLLVNWIKSFSSRYPRYCLVSFFGKKAKELHFLMHHVLTDEESFKKIPIKIYQLQDVNLTHEIVNSKRAIGKLILQID